MKIIKIEDRPDGSAIMECEFNKEEIEILVNFAITKMLKEHIESLREEENE
jgi:hypothetical protein